MATVWTELLPQVPVIKGAKHLWAARKDAKYQTDIETILDEWINIALGETHIGLSCELINGTVEIRIKNKNGTIVSQKRFYGEAGNEYIVVLPMSLARGNKYSIQLKGSPDPGKLLELWNTVLLGITEGTGIWTEIK